VHLGYFNQPLAAQVLRNVFAGILSDVRAGLMNIGCRGQSGAAFLT
jgi:hypothetical protein